MNGSFSVALTWVPNFHLFKGIMPQYQYNDTIEYINLLASCCSKYEVYPELTASGNIHYHGTICIKDTVKWFKKVLPTLKYKGFVKIKPNPNDGWTTYTSKSLELMKKLLPDVTLPITKRVAKLPIEDPITGSLLDYGLTIQCGAREAINGTSMAPVSLCDPPKESR